jgi:hypothetical protein
LICNNLSKYFYVKKNIEESKSKAFSYDSVSRPTGLLCNKININHIPELPKVDTPISVHEEIVSSIQQENNTFALPLPIVASTLITPLLAYILLILLIIAII